MSKVDENRKREKTGGRKKGTPNKKTLEFEKKLNECGFDAIGEAVYLFRNTEDDSIKANILSNFFKYLYPQRKAVEISGELNNTEPVEVRFI